MAAQSRPSRSLPIYLIPVVLGMCGILFAHQIESPTLRIVVILISVAAPLFAGGNIVARMQAKGPERWLSIFGLMLLLLGALSTASGFTESLTRIEEVPDGIVELSRYIGLVSLFIGLLALLVLTVRREEVMGEIANRFRNVAEHMGEGLVLSRPDNTIVYVNQRFLDLIGMSEDQVLGRNARNIAEEVGLELVVNRHLDKRAEGLATEYEFMWRRDGEERFFAMNGAPIYSDRGVQAGIIATVRDITQRKRLEQRLEKFAQGLQKLVEDRTEQLRESEERLRELLVHMNEGFCTIDDTYRIGFSNARLTSMLSLEGKEVEGREIFDFFDPADRQLLYDAFERCAGAQGLSREFTMVDGHGRSLAVMVAISPIQNTEGGAARYSVVITDVSHLKEMQTQLEARAAELEKANEELRVLDRAKDTFLSNVTHELRTPLSTVRGYMEMFQSGSLGELPDGQAKALNVMDRNLQRLGTLIEEMIEFSRMEIRGIRLVISLFDLGGLVEECVTSMEPQLSQKNMNAIVDVDANLGLVWGDRKRLGQVLTILLANAVKFSQERQEIRVRAWAEDDGSASVEVLDKGIGIPPAHQDRVFDKFYQVDSAMDRRYEGAGIGLSIAKSIVDAHGGVIHLVSAPKQGSAFRVLLPNCQFMVGMDDVDLSPLKDRHLKVLFVEETDFALALADLANHFSEDVRRCRSGYEALRVAQEFQPDILVMGVATGDLPCTEVTQRLHQDPSTEAIPVLQVTNETQPHDETAMAPHNAQIAAPFRAVELVDLIGKTLLGDAWTSSGIETRNGWESAAWPHVVVVDIDPDFRDWLTSGLARRNIACRTAQSHIEALVAIEEFAPRAVFLGIDSDDIDVSAVMEGLPASSGEGRPSLVAMTLLPLDRPDLSRFDGALRKPFTIDEAIVMIPDTEPQGVTASYTEA